MLKNEIKIFTQIMIQKARGKQEIVLSEKNPNRNRPAQLPV